MSKSLLVSPVLKWVGGKRQLLSKLETKIPKYNSYYEPFVGGGALFFHLQPKNGVINDLNAELINVYQVIQHNVDELIELLRMHQNNAEYFYSIRELDRRPLEYGVLSDVERASRIIYLNKTCFNGLFRVNNAGEFNAPFGKYENPNIVNEITLRAVSNYFRTSKISFMCGDYAHSLESVTKNSFVYFDPPYDPVSNSSNFTGYTKDGFNHEEQIRLKEVCDRLHKTGAKFLLSNSATNFIKELYKDYSIELIKAKRMINSKANLRGDVEEVIIRNYD